MKESFGEWLVDVRKQLHNISPSNNRVTSEVGDPANAWERREFSTPKNSDVVLSMISTTGRGSRVEEVRTLIVLNDRILQPLEVQISDLNYLAAGFIGSTITYDRFTDKPRKIEILVVPDFYLGDPDSGSKYKFTREIYPLAHSDIYAKGIGEACELRNRIIFPDMWQIKEDEISLEVQLQGENGNWSSSEIKFPAKFDLDSVPRVTLGRIELPSRP